MINGSGDGEYKLHHQESCNCENGDKGKKKKAAANKRRSDFYKTEEGQPKRYITLKELLISMS